MHSRWVLISMLSVFCVQGVPRDITPCDITPLERAICASNPKTVERLLKNRDSLGQLKAKDNPSLVAMQALLSRIVDLHQKISKSASQEEISAITAKKLKRPKKVIELLKKNNVAFNFCASYRWGNGQIKSTAKEVIERLHDYLKADNNTYVALAAQDEKFRNKIINSAQKDLQEDEEFWSCLTIGDAKSLCSLCRDSIKEKNIDTSHMPEKVLQD